MRRFVRFRAAALAADALAAEAPAQAPIDDTLLASTLPAPDGPPSARSQPGGATRGGRRAGLTVELTKGTPWRHGRG